jgi:hypothetical protein
VDRGRITKLYQTLFKKMSGLHTVAEPDSVRVWASATGRMRGLPSCATSLQPREVWRSTQCPQRTCRFGAVKHDEYACPRISCRAVSALQHMPCTLGTGTFS